MLDIKTLKAGTIIRFKKQSEGFPHLINPDWIGKKLMYMGIIDSNDTTFTYQILEDINSSNHKGDIKKNITIKTLQECMEIAVERRSHLPKWF